MSYLYSHDLTKVFAKAKADHCFCESLVTKPKESWISIMNQLVQENLYDLAYAEFAVIEYVVFLEEAILECGMVREAFAACVIPVGLIGALYDSLLVMLGPTGSLPHSKDELDLLMSVLVEPVESRPFVLAEFVLTGQLLRVHHLPTLLSALSINDNKISAHEYIGRFAAGCRKFYSFELDTVLARRFPYANPQYYDVKHLIKGYARGQPLAQFVMELFAGGEYIDDSDDEDLFDVDGKCAGDGVKSSNVIREDLDYIYSQLLLSRCVVGTLVSRIRPTSPEDRKIILDPLSDLLAEGFLDEHDFFLLPVHKYTTGNMECAKWFDDRFGGRERFRQLWIDSYERKPHQCRLGSRDLPPCL